MPFSGIYHGPLPRAAQTASLIAASLPGFRALDAPPWRWLGLNQMNCALTAIATCPGCQPG